MCDINSLYKCLSSFLFKVQKLKVVAQKKPGRGLSSIEMDSADPQSPSEWRGRLR